MTGQNCDGTKPSARRAGRRSPSRLTRTVQMIGGRSGLSFEGSPDVFGMFRQCPWREQELLWPPFRLTVDRGVLSWGERTRGSFGKLVKSSLAQKVTPAIPSQVSRKLQTAREGKEGCGRGLGGTFADDSNEECLRLWLQWSTISILPPRRRASPAIDYCLANLRLVQNQARRRRRRRRRAPRQFHVVGL